MDSVALHSSSRLWDLDFLMKYTIYFHLKRELWITEQQSSSVIFLLSPGKMLLTLFLFQKWLGSPFPEDVWAWWLLMHWLQLQFTPCEALPSVWISFTWQYSQAYGHLCCQYIFYYPTSSFQSTLHLICFDTALLEQPPLSVLNYLFICLPIYKAWNLVWSFGYCIQSRKCHVRYNSRSLETRGVCCLISPLRAFCSSYLDNSLLLVDFGWVWACDAHCEKVFWKH